MWGNRRIVVSGIGIVTGLGSSREQTWAALLAGKTAVRPSRNGLEASVMDFVPDGAHSKVGDMGLLAAEEALRHGGLDLTEIKGTNIGVAVSQSKPILSSLFGTPPTIPSPLPRGKGEGPSARFGFHSDSVFSSADEPSPVDGPNGGGDRSSNGISPSLLLSSFTGWSVESAVKNAHRLTGPSSNSVAACATGTASFWTAAQWIDAGRCERALAGASEASLFPLYRAGFERMGVLAKGNRPSAVRPFDQDRTGFAMGEGAAVLLLESLEACLGRGRRPLALLEKVVLKHSGSNGIHFDEEGRAVAELIRAACGSTIPDYINAHGTATAVNDRVESNGIRSALGRKADLVYVSSTKAGTGHLLGAAGAVEAAFTVLSLRDQVLPPTLHLEKRDPACELNIVSGSSVTADLSTALSLSYGFGGQTGAVRFTRYDG